MELSCVGLHGGPVKHELLLMHRSRPMQVIAEVQRVLDQVDFSTTDEGRVMFEKLVGINQNRSRHWVMF